MHFTPIRPSTRFSLRTAIGLVLLFIFFLLLADLFEDRRFGMELPPNERLLRPIPPICSWTLEEPLYLPDTKDAREQNIIAWLNEWNVVYAVWDGVLLGAYRHHGKIPGDEDMDIIFPVFLNSMTDDCEEVRIRRPKAFVLDPATDQEADHDNQDKDFERRLLLCNQTRYQWVEVVKEAFLRRIKATGMSGKMFISPRKYGGFRLLFGHESEGFLGVDVVVSIWDKNFWRDATPTCRCNYRGQMAQCYESTLEALQRLYEATTRQLMTPDRNPRKNMRHPMWRKKLVSIGLGSKGL